VLFDGRWAGILICRVGAIRVVVTHTLRIDKAGTCEVSTERCFVRHSKNIAIGEFPENRYERTWMKIPTGSTIDAGGDAQTDPCLKFFEFSNGTECVDMTLIFWFALETQPDWEQEKTLRFVANRSKNGRFAWYSQPVDLKISPCEKSIGPK
jgi:hypothetical protein